LLALLTELTRPPTTDRSARQAGVLSQLLRVRIRDASVQLVDQELNVTWWAPKADLDLVRQARGGVDGTASASLNLGTETVQLSGAVTLPPNRGPIHLRVRTSPFQPAALAVLLPQAAGLAAIQAPVSGEADLLMTDAMRFQSAHVALQATSGLLAIADGVMPITHALVVADITHDTAALRALRLELPASPGSAPSVLFGSGTITRTPDRYDATLALTLNHVAFAELPRLWPLGVGHGARAWVTENITAGVAHDGHVDLALEATPDLSDVTLTRATGAITGDGLRVTWLAPVPPLIDGVAVLNIVDPDTLEIVVKSARQVPEPGAPAGTPDLALTGGRMRITGIMQPHQLGVLDADISGPVSGAVALLSDPRLRLLSKHPLPLVDPTGQATAHLAMTIPLEADVSMDDIGIRAKAHLEQVHLGNVVAGHDLDNGTMDLEATAQGLTFSGPADLAGIPANLTGSMDFRAGGPAQVLQRIGVTGRATTAQLAAIGVVLTPFVDGPMNLSATLAEHRDGAGEVAVSADLTSTTLAVGALGWRKPPGQTAKASATVRLLHDRLTAIDDVTLEGSGVSAAGGMGFVDGRPAVIRIDRVTLGRSEAQATIRLPLAAGNPIAVSVTGNSLDLSGHFTHPAPRARHKPEPPSGPYWTLDARFGEVLMAGGHRITGLTATLDSDDGLMRALDVRGDTGPNAPVTLRIAPQNGKRTLRATAADAGTLLAALDIVSRIQGGKLTVTGSYDDTVVEHPLVGTAEIDDFRVRNAPVLARLLQAMTLYGLVEVVQGPGLGFTHLIAPFRLTDDDLTLTDARAFSASLGLTAKGTIDLDANTANVDGTIVPAYFFNSLLGNLPLVGRLFSPERGGGVFAASYSVHGSLDDPDVSVNPLSALTPGFLRGLFGLF